MTCEYELSGKTLHEGDRLWLSWAMANRDPSVFPDPDVIKIDRKGNRHTSFGLGLHRFIVDVRSADGWSKSFPVEYYAVGDAR